MTVAEIFFKYAAQVRTLDIIKPHEFNNKISLCHFHLARNKDAIEKEGEEWLFFINYMY